MSSEVRISTTVLPGSRIEVTAPGLPEGQLVQIVVQFDPPPKQGGILEFLDSLPQGPRSAKSWEEFEELFQAERNSWDR